MIAASQPVSCLGAIEMHHAKGPAAAATTALTLALLACPPSDAMAQAVGGAKAVKKVETAAPTTSAADAELLLRGCAGEAHRNAKLYVARAHGAAPGRTGRHRL